MGLDTKFVFLGGPKATISAIQFSEDFDGGHFEKYQRFINIAFPCTCVFTHLQSCGKPCMKYLSHQTGVECTGVINRFIVYICTSYEEYVYGVGTQVLVCPRHTP